MAFAKLRQFMQEVQKMQDTGVKPFHVTATLPRGAKRELEAVVPIFAGFRPTRVSNIYAVLSLAEMGSWEEVKHHAKEALEEFSEFIEDVPGGEQVVPIRPKSEKNSLLVHQTPPSKGSNRGTDQNEKPNFHRFKHKAGKPLEFYEKIEKSPQRHSGNSQQRHVSPLKQSRDSLKRDASPLRHSQDRQQRSNEDSPKGSVNIYRPSYNSKDSLDSDTDIESTISKLRSEIGDLKDRIDHEKAQRSVHNRSVSNHSGSSSSQRLAEFFSELYDNEWEDALEEKANGHGISEKDLMYLADIVKKCQIYIENISRREYSTLCELVLKPMGEVESQYIHIPEELSSLAKSKSRQVQRDTVSVSLPVIKEVVIRNKVPDAQNSPALKIFVERCIELLWLFNIQDPPMYLEWAREGEFMRDNLRAYSQTGNRVGFNIWPTLLLYQNGPVICKGVVQPVY